MNLTGARTLFKKEIQRFLRVPGQTVLQPLVSTTLYFIVFGYTLSSRQATVEGVPYLNYIVPGLVFLGVANNAFLNTSSSFFIMKMQGTIIDLLLAPMGPFEVLLGFVGGAMVRGVLVGLLTWGVACFFTGAHMVNVPGTILSLLMSGYVFSLLGLIAALWAEKFEQINFFPNFLMLPLTFLGGVFYSVRGLPEPFRTLSLANPIVHMVEEFRANMLGLDGQSSTGSFVLGGVGLLVTAVAWRLIRIGYKVKT
jgi:ABC-2 type transport system permease protein